MKWFDQEECIPKRDEDVLAFSSGMFFIACVNEKGTWEDPLDGRLILGVSHWMPLPKHPKKYRRYKSMARLS